MSKGSSMVALAKLMLNTVGLTESELIGVNDRMLIMFWNHTRKGRRQRIVKDLLLDNKGPSAWEQIGKTPSWKRTRYVIRVDITMGKKRSVKPNVVQVVTGEGNM